MPCYLGIDGGGSNLRAILVDETLATLREIHRPQRVNPNVIGYEAAARHIQDIIRETTAGVDQPVAAVGLGISGAPNTIAHDWLSDTVRAVLPDSLPVPSRDEEIALVGANSERRGVLVLAGTGSIACGADGITETVTIGGWGYLLGDKGSGYWLGLQALHTYLRQEEGTETRPSALHGRVQAALGWHTPMQAIPWLYHQAHTPPTSDIARLASLVLEEAEDGDWKACAIVDEAADELALLVRTLQRRLNIPDARIAFAGGLLTNDTLLARCLAQRLGLPQRPVPDHSALVGAALLAKITYEGRRHAHS